MVQKVHHIDAAKELAEIPNLGPATIRDLAKLGIRCPADLRDADPKTLYDRLCLIDGMHHDPCVLDVLMAVCDFAQGQPPAHWSVFTLKRKALWPNL